MPTELATLDRISSYGDGFVFVSFKAENGFLSADCPRRVLRSFKATAKAIADANGVEPSNPAYADRSRWEHALTVATFRGLND